MYRRRRLRSRAPRPVTQSFKKVLNFAPASHPAATAIPLALSTGTDSTAAGQTSPTDAAVPTGSKISYIEIQFSTVNLISVASFVWVTIQQLHSTQSAIGSRVVGGNTQRNQVHLQMQYVQGANQNSNHLIRFRVPAKYQRVREGSSWIINYESDTIFTSAVQVIYKFTR